MRFKLRLILASLLPFLSLSPRSLASQKLAASLQEVVDASGLPALAAAVANRERLLDAAAVGVRKRGESTPVTLDDRFHLGSCTKPLTATLAAILVEEGRLRWRSSVADQLGDPLDSLHPDYREVTLEQLLAHVGGLPAQPPAELWNQAWANQGKLPPRRQRLAFVGPLLARSPAYTPGSRTVYSNQGYAVAGAMLEAAADQDWESLLREKVFQPLGMDTAGFRAPGNPDALDQPWGHRGQTPVPPGPQADNPDAIGPAGTAHASIRDWAKFAQYHLRRQPAPLLQSSRSLDRLHQTLPRSQSHGVGGWLVHDIPRFGGHSLQMVGSNTMWYSLLWILPEQDLAIVVATNAATPEAFPALDQIAASLIQAHAAH